MASALKAISLAIGLLLVPAFACGAEKPFTETSAGAEAWWLRTQYHPFGKEVRGISLTKINPAWCKANEFRKELFPKELAASFGDDKSPFAADGFFDGSKTRQTALVGVYETCSGKHGSFLLIIGQPDGKPPEVRYFLDIKGNSDFAALSAANDGTITVSYCLECDFGSRFKWSRAKKRFVKLPPPKDSD